MIAVLIHSIMACVVATTVIAQSQFNPRDDQYRVLGLVRAKAELDRTRAHSVRATQLMAKGLVTDAERQDRAAEYERARVDYAQQLLAIATADAHVTVERANKERTAAGQSRVRLTLTSVALPQAAQLKALGIDTTITALMSDAGVADVIVSLKDAAGANGITIARPYERHVGRVGVTPTTVAFELLRETDDVVISLAYAGRLEERRVLLEQSAGTGVGAWRVDQFAQTADLGTEAVFGLSLDRIATDARPIRLSASGLPSGVDVEFRDADTKAKVDQIQFQPGQLQRRLQLVVALPARASEAIVAERAVRFKVVAEAERAPGAMGNARSETTLEITPRGVPRAELRIDNLLIDAHAGDTIATILRVRNTGARTLHGVRIVAELPAAWTATMIPSILPPLIPGDEVGVTVRMLPGETVSAGDYEATLRLAGEGLREAGAPARILRVRLSDAGSTTWVLAGLVMLLLAIGWYALRTMRQAVR